MNYYLVFLVIASSITCLSSQSTALAINRYCNPIGIDLSQLSTAEFGREFTLKQGEKAEVSTIALRGLARSLVLSIEKFKDASQPDKRIYQIKTYHVEEYPNCHQINLKTVLISRSADYTLNPRSMSDQFERKGLRNYRQYIGIDGIMLELLDFTPSGEAKIKLTRESLPSSTNFPELNVVRDRPSLIRLKGQKVRLVGYYVSQTRKADPQTTNNFGFTGEHRTSQVVLEDGTIVSIFPIGDKQFLRPVEEVNQYQGKIIEAVGVVDFNSETRKNPAGSSFSFFINLEKLVGAGEFVES